MAEVAMTSASTHTTAGASVISPSAGGGTISRPGEQFTPDLLTGTGAPRYPISVPGGLQPRPSVSFSTGNVNGAFGLRWELSLPGITHKTSHEIVGTGRPTSLLLRSDRSIFPHDHWSCVSWLR
jgi:hypothetical protein